MTVATVEAIRADFPALRRSEGGHAVAYFDGPGGTQVPQPVVDAMADYLLCHNANTHWEYPTSAETDAALLDAREVFAAFVGGAADEISFGNNMTTIAFHVARALARDWNPGDEVIVTELDHHGNVAPWQAIARDRGVVLRWLPLDMATGELRLDRLPQLLGPRTRLLAINAASNILGTVSDVARAAKLAHDAGALVFVDGVHYAPHRLTDVSALGADFFAASAYKFHGPHIGVLWARRDLVERLDVPRLEPAPDTSPERMETGTQNHEGIVGAARAVRWLAGLAGDGNLRSQLATTYAEIHRREMALFATLWDGLGAIDGVTRFGPPATGSRTATVSFSVRGIDSEQVARTLARGGCYVSHGDFYASTVAHLAGFERAGLVRLGAACYTTGEEIDRVLTGICKLAR
ncbi:MAG TPA: cysteine desulfurase-like protein [Gemmatimonadales bacterium]|jgi:cysteine desulfurase family protein (TIGR01976 family)